MTRPSVWVQSAAGRGRCSAERGESPRVPLACLPACAEVRVPTAEVQGMCDIVRR